MEPLRAKGINGQVTFDGAFVTIARKGFVARSTIGGGDKHIPLSAVSAVQYKAPTAMFNGALEFSLAGGNEAKSRFGTNNKQASQNENAVIMRKSALAEFDALVAAINSAIAARSNPVPAVVASGADEVMKLAALRDAGILSDDEFAAAKAKALGL